MEIKPNNPETGAAGSPEKVETPETPKVPSQDPVKNELDRVTKPSRLEKARKRREILDEEIEKLEREEGIEPDEEDSKPLTVGEFKKLKAEEARKTALDMADDIEDDNVRELTKNYLKTRIVPSGNPAEDFKFALSAVNSLRNSQIAEEMARKGTPKTYSSASGVPATQANDNFVPTPEEESMMRPPFNLSREHILASRKATQERLARQG